MNRRDFMKAVGASGMVASAPILSSNAAATDLTPVGKYFILAHLGGGWEATTFCNPQGNRLRIDVGLDTGDDNVRNPGSPVNKFPVSAIRSAADIYAGSATISTEMKYAPYLGTFNDTGRDDDDNSIIDDGSANDGFTTSHIQRILSGSVSGAELTASPAGSFVWKSTTSVATIQSNATAILDGSVATINLNGIEGDLVDRNLAVNMSDATAFSRIFIYDAFVCLYADELRVLNGVANTTVGHSIGTRFADTGSMSSGYPDFTALYAAVKGADRPMAWVTDNSGSNSAADLVARSSASDASVFDLLSDPKGGRIDLFESALDTAHSRRKALQRNTDTLPMRQFLQDQLYLVREQGVEFTDVASAINNPADAAQQAVKDAANTTRKRHMRVGVAGFSAGMASSMQVGFYGFDTHGDHDDSHFPLIRDVLAELHFLYTALDAYGIRDQTTTIIASDFGRTPWYNDGNGKDHWSITSYMLLGNGVAGGTSVNATNGLIEALTVDPVTLKPVSSGGSIMSTANIHKELRKFAGIENDAITLEFPIDAEDMSILG